MLVSFIKKFPCFLFNSDTFFSKTTIFLGQLRTCLHEILLNVLIQVFSVYIFAKLMLFYQQFKTKNSCKILWYLMASL